MDLRLLYFGSSCHADEGKAFLAAAILSWRCEDAHLVPDASDRALGSDGQPPGSP
ncbi:hypothetical protein BX257_4004 [Streptomyces sp. 3212.3]|nr:hypothetical protein BX257_4004 [Streptomyces sp. 3212.3]